MQSVTFSLDQLNTNYTSYVTVDGTVGLNTVFTFTWSSGSTPPIVYLQTPGGCVYTTSTVTGNLTLCPDNPIDDIQEESMTIIFIVPGVAEVRLKIVCFLKKNCFESVVHRRSTIYLKIRNLTMNRIIVNLYVNIQ